MIEYHDVEWGVPQHNDVKLFEALILEIAQAGLSWITILKKRENYRIAFDGFDPEVIALYNSDKLSGLMSNPGIVKNKHKISSTVSNAKAFIQIGQQFGGFDKYIWNFVNGRPIKNHRKHAHDLPAKTMESEIMSRDLRARGFKFVGPVICYAFMQSQGMANDHLVDCFRYH